MAKKQGKVKSIPVKDVTEGIQVLWNNLILKVWETNETERQPKNKNTIVLTKDGKYAVNAIWTNLLELKTLVVEYNEQYMEYGIPINEFKQLPLKYSQWQSTIDNGEVDSDKMVEFEIKLNRDYHYDLNGDIADRETLFHIAKIIIPHKNRMYTEDELREAMKYASSHLSSLNSINEYIKKL